MTTERDRNTRIVLSWLREDTHENAERVLLLALDEADTTPQRRSWWPAWRISEMNKLALTAMAAAAVLAIAFVGYNLLAQRGAGGPNAGPSPSPSPLAVGNFVSHGVTAQIDARGAGANVTGTLTVEDAGLRATVALECSQATDDRFLEIGGLVTESTFDDHFPEGRRVGVIFERGSPLKAVWYIALLEEPLVESCGELVEDVIKADEFGAALEPIEGSVTLAP